MKDRTYLDTTRFSDEYCKYGEFTGTMVGITCADRILQRKNVRTLTSSNILQMRVIWWSKKDTKKTGIYRYKDY